MRHWHFWIGIGDLRRPALRNAYEPWSWALPETPIGDSLSGSGLGVEIALRL